MAAATAEDLQAQLEEIRQIASQVAAHPAPPIAAMNNRVQRDFQAQKNRRLQVLNERANDVRAQMSKLPQPPKPPTDAQQALAEQRRQKIADDAAKTAEAVRTQKEAADLAKSRAEQQKTAAGESKVALGAGGKSLADLLATGTQKYDPATGNVTFDVPNTKGTLTPLQQRNAAELKAALARQGVTSEELFGPGAAAPQFNEKGLSVVTPGGSPFIGSKADFDSLRSLYDKSQPSQSSPIAIPKGVFEKSYLDTVPKYGESFPENPVYSAARQEREGNRADAFNAFPAGGRPFDFDIRQGNGPLTPAPTGASAQELLDKAGGITPAQAGAAKLAATGAPNAMAILAQAKEQGLDPADPTIATALRQDSEAAALDKLPGQIGSVAKGAFNSTTPGALAALGSAAGRQLTEAPGVIGDALDTFIQQQEEDRKRQEAAMKLRGIDPNTPITPDIPAY